MNLPKDIWQKEMTRTARNPSVFSCILSSVFSVQSSAVSCFDPLLSSQSATRKQFVTHSKKNPMPEILPGISGCRFAMDSGVRGHWKHDV